MQNHIERAARWGTDVDALESLSDAGYTLNRDCSWNPPDREPTICEIDAIIYLIEEWDFEGLRGLSASEAERHFRLA